MSGLSIKQTSARANTKTQHTRRNSRHMKTGCRVNAAFYVDILETDVFQLKTASCYEKIAMRHTVMENLWSNKNQKHRRPFKYILRLTAATLSCALYPSLLTIVITSRPEKWIPGFMADVSSETHGWLPVCMHCSTFQSISRIYTATSHAHMRSNRLTVYVRMTDREDACVYRMSVSTGDILLLHVVNE